MLKLHKDYGHVLSPYGLSLQDDYSSRMRSSWARIEGDTILPLTVPSACKDYLTDSLVVEEEDPTHKRQVYTYNGPLQHDYTNLALVVPPAFKDNIIHFQEYELELGLDPVMVHETNIPDMVGIQGDAWWHTTTLHLSLFVSFLRNLSGRERVGSMEEARTDVYIWRVLPNAKKLASALKHIEYIRRRNAPDLPTMHGLNGHYTYLTTGPSLRAHLTYTKQLMEIDPTIPLARDALGSLKFPVEF